MPSAAAARGVGARSGGVARATAERRWGASAAPPGAWPPVEGTAGIADRSVGLASTDGAAAGADAVADTTDGAAGAKDAVADTTGGAVGGAGGIGAVSAATGVDGGGSAAGRSGSGRGAM